MNYNYQSAYKRLNLPRSANWQQAKTNYRRLIQTWHPDKFDANSAESSIAHTKFLEINNSYKLLHSFYTEHRKLPLEPETLSDTDFIDLQRAQTKRMGTGNVSRKRNRNKTNKGTASKLSFVLGLAMVIFLLINSAKEGGSASNIEGDISVNEPTTDRTTAGSGWNHLLGEVSNRNDMLGSSRRNLGNRSINGLLD